MKKITKEDQATLKEKFPKFSKITACMVNNPEYGVTLSPEAKRWLNQGKTQEKQRPKSKVVSVRLTLEEMNRIEKHILATSQSISDYLKGKLTDDD